MAPWVLCGPFRPCPRMVHMSTEQSDDRQAGQAPEHGGQEEEGAWAGRRKHGPQELLKKALTFKCVRPVLLAPHAHTHTETEVHAVCRLTFTYTHAHARTHTHTHAHVHSPALHPRPRHTRGKTALTLAPSQCSLWLLFQTTGFNLCAFVALRENTLILQHRTFRGLDRARGARGPQGRGAHADGHSWAHTRSLPGGVFLPGTPGGFPACEPFLSAPSQPEHQQQRCPCSSLWTPPRPLAQLLRESWCKAEGCREAGGGPVLAAHPRQGPVSGDA